MRRHIKSGTLDSEYFQAAIDEAKTDPIGFMSVVRTGRYGFGLDGVDLERFVFDYVYALLKAGANPVHGDRLCPSGWVPDFHYGADAEVATRAIVTEWKAALKDPDVDDVWFAFPSVWEC